MPKTPTRNRKPRPTTTSLNDQLLAFLRIANAMLEAKNLDQVLGAITSEVARIVEFDRSSVAVVTPDGQSLLLRNIHKGHQVGDGRRIAMDESSVIGWVALNRKPLARNDIRSDDRFSEIVREECLRSDVVLPLTAGDDLVGTLNVGSYSPDAFTPADVDVLTKCSRFASLAIQHTMLRLKAQELSERYQLLQRNANDMILIVDRRNGCIVEANRKCETVLGYGRDALIGRSYFDLFAQAERVQSRRDFVNMLGQKNMAMVDRCMMGRLGDTIYVDINASLIKIKEDVFIQVIIHDVSQRRALEQQIIQKNQDLQAVNEKLRKVDQMKSDFLANISHELRTPLSIIIAYTESLRDPSLSEDERNRFMDVIAQNGQNLLGLINNLLELSKLEISDRKLHRSLTHVHDVIKFVWSQVTRHAADRNLDIDFEPGPDIPVLYLDNNQIAHVITCLLQNAIKFTDSPGTVRARTSRRGNEVWIEVSDDGAGIGPDEVASVFETFHQADASSSRRWGGLGIGLALARHIVELHKGRVWVESELGKGSTFTVALPIETESVFRDRS